MGSNTTGEASGSGFEKGGGLVGTEAAGEGARKQAEVRGCTRTAELVGKPDTRGLAKQPVAEELEEGAGARFTLSPLL